MFAQEANVADLWELDTLGIIDPIKKKTREEHQAQIMKNFRHTIKINEHNRYEVLLPWKNNHLSLADNKDAARHRLESLTRKLKSQNLYNDYREVLEEWLTEGII